MEYYGILTLRTLLLYILILVIFRLMGKRGIGELSLLDLVVFVMIAELAVVAIEKPETKLLPSLFPMILLLFIQFSLAQLSLKSKRIRDLIDGQPTVIINKGKINRKAMRNQRYNYDDLLLQLREKDIRNIADVEFAILETSGKLSVIKKEKKKSSITIPLIIDGKIQEQNLDVIDKTSFWLRKELKQRGYNDISAISFCSFQDGEFYLDFMD